MNLDAAIKHEGDVALLNCETPQPLPVSGCHFYFVGKEIDARHAASCQLILRGRDLIKWQDQNLPIRPHIGCYFYVNAGLGLRYPHDLSSSVTVFGMLTDIYKIHLNLLCDKKAVIIVVK